MEIKFYSSYFRFGKFVFVFFLTNSNFIHFKINKWSVSINKAVCTQFYLSRRYEFYFGKWFLVLELYAFSDLHERDNCFPRV